MSIAFVDRVQGGNSSTGNSIATPAANHIAGNLLVVGVHYQGATAISIADTAGNTWIAATTQIPTTGSGNHVMVWYAYNITGNASNVVTATYVNGVPYRAIVALQFSGIQTASDPKDSGNGATGSSTSPATSSLTVTAAEDLIFAFMECDARSITAGSGYTLTDFAITGDANKYFADEYKIVTASEAATASCGNGGWEIAGAAFKGLSSSATNPGWYGKRGWF